MGILNNKVVRINPGSQIEFGTTDICMAVFNFLGIVFFWGLVYSDFRSLGVAKCFLVIV
jgi:hypothetical protein